MNTDTKLPDDLYSKTLRGLQGNPGAVEKTSIVDLVDFYGNAETWTIRTIRADGEDTVFLQHITAAGGSRVVLPAEVTAAIARQRDGATDVNRRRGARAAAATRKAKGKS